MGGSGCSEIGWTLEGAVGQAPQETQSPSFLTPPLPRPLPLASASVFPPVSCDLSNTGTISHMGLLST